MKLQPLNRHDMETIREWRDEVPNTLRTPYMLTQEMQREYYDTVICNRDSHTRYWAFMGDPETLPIITGEMLLADSIGVPISGQTLIGYGGLENIEWENSRAEISVLISPDHRHEGRGREAVGMILERAFSFMNLHSVHGECYTSGPVPFWQKIVAEYDAFHTWIPCTKYYQGKYHQSYYFTFERGEK